MTLDELHAAMDAAVARLDFEEAARLRDRISLVRAGGDDDAAQGAAGLVRQRPGAMGLGSSRQRIVPPEGWTAPARPDPMTRRRSRRKSD